jgi:protein-disulfide isomerase
MTGMTLKDRLNDALAATPPENIHRQDTLRAALNAGDTDAEVEAALSRLIIAREQKAIALEKSGQTEQAAQERSEAAELQKLLRGSEAPATQAGATRVLGKRAGGLISRTQWIIGSVAVVVLAVALFVVLRPSDQSDDLAATTSQKVSVFKDDHTLGNPKAPITILEYAAPMCPVCARFTLDEFPQFKREFIDTGKVFFIFRVFPLGAPDGAVEGIARCLPKERYFPYIEMMFREQPQWDPDGYQIPDVAGAIIRLASSEGISPERAKQCMSDPAQQERINQVAQDAQIRYQLEGTPTFVMDGQVVNFPPSTKTRLEVLRLRINSLSSTKNQ